MIPEKLERFINNENRTSYRQDLDHVRALLALAGNPHESLTTIHIAGTNGKGSVAHMLNSILMQSGYKTGLYTSPHLLDISERIRIQDEYIPDEVFGGYIDDISASIESTGIAPTYFDVMTVCAFRYFYENKVDIAVIETGLGGRFDSTNVITPCCSVITSISMDHMNILGNTLEAIAREKAGIVKRGVPVVSADQDPPALDVIVAASHKNRSEIYVLNKNFFTSNIVETGDGFFFDYALNAAPMADLRKVEIKNPLPVQVKNASLAITASLTSRKFLPDLNEEGIRKGILRVMVPGRCQILSSSPLVLYDPAHNEAAIELMIGFALKKYARRTITLVLTLMKDKKIDGILSTLKHYGLPAVYFTLDDARCYLPHDSGLFNFEKVITYDEEALFRMLDEMRTADSLFFFLGSFRLYRTALNYAKRR
jgi:dihydrofolate synthase/folylpolyglutamate synthase